MRHEHPLLRFFKGLSHFFALILWVAAALAFFAEWSAPGEGMAKVGYAIVVVILVSAVFSFWQEYRAEQTLAALRQLLPQRRARTCRHHAGTGWSKISPPGHAWRPDESPGALVNGSLTPLMVDAVGRFARGYIIAAAGSRSNDR